MIKFKRYCKATLNAFLNKKLIILTRTKKIYMINILCHIKNFLLNMQKLFKIPGFLVIFVQNSRFFTKFLKFKVFPVFYLPKLSNFRFLQVKWQPWFKCWTNLYAQWLCINHLFSYKAFSLLHYHQTTSFLSILKRIIPDYRLKNVYRLKNL